MNTWAARLAERRENFQKPLGGSLTKPTKAPFVSFGGNPDGSFQNIAPPLNRVSGLAEIRHLLHAIADSVAVDADLIHNLQDADVAACIGLSKQTLLAFVRALADSDLRRRGKVPADETAMALCRGCGLVWVAPEVADAAPVIDGWPRLLGCAWCHVRHAGKFVPRPSVQCGECQHFERDAINPAAGVGRCRLGRELHHGEPMHYPNATRQCLRFTP